MKDSINLNNQKNEKYRYSLGIKEATKCHDKKTFVQTFGLEKYDFVKTNEKGFEDFLSFDVEKAKE